MLVRSASAVTRPTLRSVRSLAVASVVLNVVIILTGATVRLTESGLGCPQWPHCTGDSLVPTRAAGAGTVHMVIEFGNRLVALPVLAAAVACLVAALRLRPRRADLTALSGALVAGILVQAVVGGISVYAKLNPVPVATHFLLSMGVLAAALALVERTGRPQAPAAGAPVRTLARVMLAATFLVLALGTVVTGSGPHAGDASAPRLPLPIETVARVHSAAAWAMVALTVALLLAARLASTPEPVGRRVQQLLVLQLAQGAVGYVQYFAGIPEPLVAVHVLGAVLTWIAALRVWYAARPSASATVSAEVVPAREAAAPS